MTVSRFGVFSLDRIQKPTYPEAYPIYLELFYKKLCGFNMVLRSFTFFIFNKESATIKALFL